MTRILVNFENNGTQKPSNSLPAVWNSTLNTAVGTTFADLVDSTGVATGISLSVGVGSSFANGGSSTAFTSDYQGYDQKAWRNFWSCSGNDDALVLSGFAPNQAGTCKFGAFINAGRDTRIDDQNGNTATAVAQAQPPNTVATLNWQADASGVLTLSPIVVSLTSYIQFLDFEYTAPSYTITSIDGDNDVQAGQSNVDIIMTATTGVTSVTLGGETLTINGVS